MTETESMVVRVAKAMISAIDEKEAFVRENDGICDVTVDGHVDFKALARAAIEAMKEPTPGVLADGYNTLDFDDGVDHSAEEFNRRVVQRVWSAMIEAALK